MATFLALSVRYERFLLALFSYYLAGCGAALELPPCPSSEAEGYGVLRDPGVPICRMSTLHVLHGGSGAARAYMYIRTWRRLCAARRCAVCCFSNRACDGTSRGSRGRGVELRLGRPEVKGRAFPYRMLQAFGFAGIWGSRPRARVWGHSRRSRLWLCKMLAAIANSSCL
jgi:pimeloyl-ACP methyl ester carboxylesterase